MNILIIGARGFLGGHLAQALEARGHRVIRGGRPRPGRRDGSAWVPADFSQDTAAAVWMTRLRGVDAVVNAAGIFHEQAGNLFETAHITGPAALFEACTALGISRAVHVSAVGADAQAESPYHLSKREGDRAVLAIHPTVSVVQPSLVFGAEGDSSRLFLALACLPVIPVPAGTQWVQPVHVDDAVQAIVALLETPGHEGSRVPLVGLKPVAWRDYLAALRGSLGLGPPRFMSIPHPLVDAAARLAGLSRRALLDIHSWRMLERGNTADASAIGLLLGRSPRQPENFVTALERQTLQTRARLDLLLPFLRLMLAIVWLVTAVVSLGVYPIDDSLALLARVGLHGDMARLMLVGAAGTDFALGLATLWWPGRRLWWAQMALIAFYTAVISAWLPEYWAHPYGPVLKNVAVIGVLTVLLSFEERR